jgi:hypothetical protein
MNISIDRFAPAGPRAVRPGLALALALALGLAGCASGPRERDLLPDEGPTTLEVYERHLSGATAGETEGTGLPEPSDALDRVRPDGSAGPAGRAAPAIPVAWSGEPIAPEADADTRRGGDALADLQRDFQQVHNPEILGYVYPHLAGDLPVPGYYTVFPLRDGSRYAEPGEGRYPGVVP